MMLMSLILCKSYFLRCPKKGFICEFCGKAFAQRQGRHNHKQRCKGKDVPVASKDYHKLEQRVEFLEQQCKAQVSSNQTGETDAKYKKLELELQFYKNRKSEAFYQKVLEQHLGGTHKTLSCGVTDVTTDTCHAEAKEWKSWKEGVGQLMCYNAVDPKETLQMYMFGSYGEKNKAEAIKVLNTYNIQVFEFQDDNSEVSIVDLKDNSKHFVYKP